MSAIDPFEEGVCPDCFGSGWDWEYGDDCLRCEGHGSTYVETPGERLGRVRTLEQLLDPTPERWDELRAMPYDEYLWSPEWRERRAMHLRQANFTCDRCGLYTRAHRGLHVHHLTYERFGREQPEDLEVLCVDCHRGEHGIRG